MCAKYTSVNAHERFFCRWNNVISTRSTRYYRVTLAFFSEVSTYRFASCNAFLRFTDVVSSVGIHLSKIFLSEKERNGEKKRNKHETVFVLTIEIVCIFQCKTVLNRFRSHESKLAPLSRQCSMFETKQRIVYSSVYTMK